MGLGEERNHRGEVPLSSYQGHTLLICFNRNDVNLDHPCWGHVVRFLHYKMICSPPPLSPYCVLFGRKVTMHRSQVGSGEWPSTSKKGSQTHKFYGILLHRRFVSSPPCIYIFSHFLTSLWTCGYSYFKLQSGIAVLQYYFWAQMVPALPTGRSFSLLKAFCCCCVRSFSSMSLFSSMRSSGLSTLPAPTLDPSHVSKGPRFLLWKNGIISLYLKKKKPLMPFSSNPSIITITFPSSPFPWFFTTFFFF